MVDDAMQRRRDAAERNAQHAARIRRCRGCGAPIVFVATPRGASLPCDASTVGMTEFEYHVARHTRHRCGDRER